MDTLIWIWIGIGGGTLLVLLKIPAPYGKLKKGNWGWEINNKLGWYIMELPALIVFLTTFFGASSLIDQLSQDTLSIAKIWQSLWEGSFFLQESFSLPPLHQDFLSNGWSWVTGIAALLFVIHYSYRSLIFPWRLQTSKKRMPFLIVSSGIFFNSVNGVLNGLFLGAGFFTPDNDFTKFYQFFPETFSATTLIISLLGIAVFILGFSIHFFSDNKLIELRKQNRNPTKHSNRNGYQIPRGFLFEYISSPNYFGEILQWLGFFLITQSLAAFSFLVWVIANLFPRALDNHQWYHKKFSNYPRRRKAIIPFLL